jgi:hypothetical protein
MNDASDEQRVGEIYEEIWNLGQRFAVAGEGHDVRRQREILQEMAQLRSEQEAIRSNRRAALITAVAAAETAANETQRIAMLLTAFTIAARLNVFASDVMPDLPTQHFAVKREHAIVRAFDSTTMGRAALLPLLDHTDPGIRISAAVQLRKLFPDRALAVMHEVHETERGTSAGIIALTGLYAHKWETQERSADVEAR